MRLPILTKASWFALCVATLSACGGETTSAEERAGAGGASNTGGTSSASGGTSSAAGGAGGTTSPVAFYLCFDWDEIGNEPVPGKVVIEACPSFNGLDVAAFQGVNCVWFAEPPDPVVPPSPEEGVGDCCYGVTYHHCR